ncbi:MAG: YitT family protein, partial [Clostridiales bacterium]
IADNLMKGIKRGVTILPAVGGYSQEEKDVVFCVVSRFELAPLKEIVQDTDPDAFVCINEVYEVMGKFARKAPRNNPNGANSR